MKIPTLDEFVAACLADEFKWHRSAYVKEPGFGSMYIRVTRNLINGEPVETLVLANITAKVPGHGAFTELVSRLITTYPSLTLYVENVLQERFAAKLLRMGFVKNEAPGLHGPPWSYYLPRKS